MPIEFRCAKCSRLLRTPDDSAGKQAKCPECGEVTTIPAGSDPPTPPAGGPASPFGPASAGQSPFDAGAPVGPSAADQNPYRSPVDFSPPATGYRASTGQIYPTQIDLGDVLSRTWTVFKDRLGICLGAFFLAFFVNLLVGQLLTQGAAVIGALSKEEGVMIALGVLANLAAQAFSLWIAIGQAMVFLHIARGEPVELGELFAGGPYLLRAIGASILFFFGFLVGIILLIVPGIIFALMFSQFFYLIIDRNLGVVESLEVSRQVTSGNKLTLFALGFVVLGLMLVAILPCGLGLIILWPFVSLLWPVTYLSMTGQPTAEQVQLPYQPA